MKAPKVIATMFAVLVVLLVALGVGILLFANSAVRRAVESAGTNALAVPLDVNEAQVSILGGSLALQGVAAANPPGYSGKTLLELRDATIKADLRSLLSDRVVIHDIQLDKMEVFVEQKGLKNNLYEVIEPLRAEREPSGKRLIIDNLAITNIAVHVDLPVIPGQPPVKGVTFKLAPITMTNLGHDERLDTPVLITKVLLAVAAGIAEQGGDILPKEMVGELSNVLNKAIDFGRVIFGNGKNGGRQGEGAATELGRSVTEGLKNLIGPGSPKKQE